MSRAARILSVCAGIVLAGGLAAYYVLSYLVVTPPVVNAAGTTAQQHLTLQTVASLGFKPHPDWVSYLVKNPQGKWVHSTVFRVPANSVVTVTILQYDTATGLRNPFWGHPRGLVGGTFKVQDVGASSAKTVPSLDPDLASHTFAIPQLGVSVPLKGVPDDAKNQCSVAPCTLAEAHTTITFRFRTGKRGKYRWQCFVPCAAAFPLGFGGPMQSLGYMDGYLQVV